MMRKSPTLNPVYVANMIAHLANWERNADETWTEFGAKVPDINTHILGAIKHLDDLHKELTGDFAPIPKSQDTYRD